MTDSDQDDGLEIEVLDAAEAVRRRPTMYVGPLEASALPARLLRQALCHAIDCALEDACSAVLVQIQGRNATVSYDAGIPLEIHPQYGQVVARLFLTVHLGCKSLKKHIEVGDELCDLGLAVLNALCEAMTVTTVHNGETATFAFAEGREVDSSDITATTAPDRTEMLFRLDPRILGANVVFAHADVHTAIGEVRALLPRLQVDLQME